MAEFLAVLLVVAVLAIGGGCATAGGTESADIVGRVAEVHDFRLLDGSIRREVTFEWEEETATGILNQRHTISFSFGTREYMTYRQPGVPACLYGKPGALRLRPCP